MQILIIRYAVSEILPEIHVDHKCPNWTFRTIKITFRMIPMPFIFKDRIGFTTKKLHDAINWAEFRYY